MSVLIKGMKMPKDCWECVLCNTVKDDEDDYEINMYCHATGESLENLDVRGDRCPLVPVPTPHGRLIDANKLLKKGIPLSWSVQKWVSEVDIGLMRTIIEAEEGDINVNTD